MANELTVIQQKAVSLRSYLHNDKIKSTLADALPKWLSIDRMLRIVFSTAMKNPKILECTQESILQSVMMCSQLGLEPILGRAYLIPYQNSKNINGKWVKVYECQMQPGYQGLVDLARRSDNIADIWGHNVYENDEFDMMYGMGRDIHHRPWFMNAETKSKGPGEIIGAYVVWLLKDGTKHPEFMHISEIHKRRDVSQAYQWAEAGDKSKGGGKKDSVWHKWPEEMNLKTVVKHSSKLVPSSIEFMEAISIDDQAEAGKAQEMHFAYDVSPAIQHVERSVDDLIMEFHSLTENWPDVIEFIGAVAKSQGMGPDQAKAQIIRENDFDNFKAAYDQWAAGKVRKKNGSSDSSDASDLSGSGSAGGENQEKGPAPEKKQQETSTDADALNHGAGSSESEEADKDEMDLSLLPGPWNPKTWVNLKSPGVRKHAETFKDLYQEQPIALHVAFADKWSRCADLPRYPFDGNGVWIGYDDPADAGQPETEENGLQKGHGVANVDPEKIMLDLGQYLQINHPEIKVHMLRNFIGSRSAASGVPVHEYALKIMSGDTELINDYDAWMHDKM